MTGFASAADVQETLNRIFTVEEWDWIETLLAQSATYLRSVIGQHVYPPVTATFTAYPVHGRVALPQSYVGETITVQVGETDIPFTRFEDTIEGLDGYTTVDVTFTYGAILAPTDLVGVNVAMVSSAITLVEADLGVNVGGLSSLALDDFKIAFADGGDKTGHMVLPELTQANLRAAYGASGGTGEYR